MRIYIIALLLLLCKTSFGKEYNMKLTFVDGYTNKVIANEKLTLKIISIDWSEEFVTDSNGSIQFDFEAEHFIQYNFRFESGDFQFQTRQRYLSDDSEITITFNMYPSRKYEKRILEKEKNTIENLTEAPDSISCLEDSFLEQNSLDEYLIDENLQLPYWYGDYGFKVKYLVQVTLDPFGTPLLVEVVESSDDHLIMEIIRLVRLSPKWDQTPCGEKYSKTIQLPIIIDRDNLIWEE